MFIVLFEDDCDPKVLHGVDPLKYDGAKILINPVLPRGVPPHRWKRGKNCIEVMPEPAVVVDLLADSIKDLPCISKPILTLKHYLLAAGVLIAAIAILIKVL